MSKYSLDIRVYEPANMYEVPFSLPKEMVGLGANLKTGDFTIGTNCTEEQFNDFLKWSSDHERVLKIIGWEKLG